MMPRVMMRAGPYARKRQPANSRVLPMVTAGQVFEGNGQAPQAPHQSPDGLDHFLRERKLATRPCAGERVGNLHTLRSGYGHTDVLVLELDE
jgi:hypothetical protein